MSRYTGRRSLLDRFNEKWELDPSSGCWLWTASVKDDKGYGAIGQGGKGAPVLRAHRASWMLFRGAIPKGMQVDHVCHVKKCVNPDHLRLATNKQNVENAPGLRSDNPTGYRGVKRAGKKFKARVRHHGVLIELGTFDTAAEAGEIARVKRLELFTHNDLDRQS